MRKAILTIFIALSLQATGHAEVSSFIQTLNVPEVKDSVEKVIQRENTQPSQLTIRVTSSTNLSVMLSLEMFISNKKCNMLIVQSFDSTSKEVMTRIFSGMACEELEGIN